MKFLLKYFNLKMICANCLQTKLSHTHRHTGLTFIFQVNLGCFLSASLYVSKRGAY